MDPNNDDLSDEFSDFSMFKFAQTATELNPKAKEWSQASPSTSATSTSNGYMYDAKEESEEDDAKEEKDLFLDI